MHRLQRSDYHQESETAKEKDTRPLRRNCDSAPTNKGGANGVQNDDNENEHSHFRLPGDRPTFIHQE